MLYWYYIKIKYNYNTLAVPCEIFILVSFASSIMKNINLLLFPFRFPVKLICCVIIFLTSCNFSNVFICLYIIFNWLIKKVSSINHNIIVFYYCSWKEISQVSFSSEVSLALNVKTKSLFTPWKLDSIKISKYCFGAFCAVFIAFIPVNCAL